MPLRFPGAWRLKPPADGTFVNEIIPNEAVSECIDLIRKAATQDDWQKILEHFKMYFCVASGSSYSRSSSVSWAETDLWTYAKAAAKNAPLFLEGFYDACQTLAGDDPDIWAPDVDIINHLLAKHRIGYVLQPPRLQARENMSVTIEVAPPPPTLAERAATVLQESLTRSEQLLAERRGREAVQELLWLLETVATAFRGVETTTGSVEGKYFNQIVRDLRTVAPDGVLNRVLEWITSLHGYLSSPTGGGIRHGLDLRSGVQIDDNEARLFCNLIRSYLSFLLVEHQHLARR